MNQNPTSMAPKRHWNLVRFAFLSLPSLLLHPFSPPFTILDIVSHLRPSRLLATTANRARQSPQALPGRRKVSRPYRRRRRSASSRNRRLIGNCCLLILYPLFAFFCSSSLFFSVASDFNLSFKLLWSFVVRPSWANDIISSFPLHATHHLVTSPSHLANCPPLLYILEPIIVPLNSLYPPLAFQTPGRFLLPLLLLLLDPSGSLPFPPPPHSSPLKCFFFLSLFQPFDDV